MRVRIRKVKSIWITDIKPMISMRNTVYECLVVMTTTKLRNTYNKFGIKLDIKGDYNSVKTSRIAKSCYGIDVFGHKLSPAIIRFKVV